LVSLASWSHWWGMEKIFAGNSTRHLYASESANGLELYHMSLGKAGDFIYSSGGPSQWIVPDTRPKFSYLHGQGSSPIRERRASGSPGMEAQIRVLFLMTLPLSKSDNMVRGRAGSVNWCLHTAEIVDELCFIKSMQTGQIKPWSCYYFFQTRPSAFQAAIYGAWMSYGLGSEQFKPTFPFYHIGSKNACRITALFPDLGERDFLPQNTKEFKFGPAKTQSSKTAGIREKLRRKDRREMLNYLHITEWAQFIPMVILNQRPNRPIRMAFEWDFP